MLYAIHLLDKPGSADLRANNYPEHKAYLTAKADQIAFAGPLMADDSQTLLGSLLVIDFDSREAATEWANNEPFTRAGVYASRSIYAFTNRWEQKVGFPAD